MISANCDVVKPKVVAAEHISQFNEEAHSSFVLIGHVVNAEFALIICPTEPYVLFGG
uniref:Uncharacterized protein n=1 Tax=Helianthus annuus TaxID=4232 RepID=A0A251TL05_HELAN